MQINEVEFNQLSLYLENLSGIKIEKEKSYLFKTRLTSFLKEEKYKSFSEFYLQLSTKKDPILQKKLVMAMTTHESSFFRDRHPFELLREKLIPEIAKRKKKMLNF